MANQTDSASLSNENVPGGDRSAARQRFIACRQQIAASEREAWDRLLCLRLRELFEEHFAVLLARREPPAIVAIYSPIRAEPDLRVASEWLRSQGVRLALPRVVGRAQPLEFGLFEHDTALRTASFGVRVPDPFILVQPHLLIIPCVAFRPDGYRLGYGGGFYDRTLAAQPVPSIGVAYDNGQWLDWQTEPHDRQLDWIVTPTRTLASRASRGL